MGGDLHTKRLSHVSIPIEKGLEWHISKKDLPKGVDAKATSIHIPVKGTSDDKEAVRYKQKGKALPENVHGHEVERYNKSA
jgi:hypothetical protein